jgi:hypothetical protein
MLNADSRAPKIEGEVFMVRTQLLRQGLNDLGYHKPSHHAIRDVARNKVRDGNNRPRSQSI